MSVRDTVKLKELIYEVLSSDATLISLVGGKHKIKHGNPLAKSEYPCLVYGIIGDSDEPYKPDFATGLVKTRLMIQAFSDQVSSKIADQIEDRVYTLLHGKRLSNSDYMVYTAYRNSRFPIFEPQVSIWRVEARYDLVNVLKSQ